jgi:hypothetical protein
MLAGLNAAVTRRWGIRIVALAIAIGAARLVVPWWCGRDAAAWLRGDPEIQRELASELVAFEAAIGAVGSLLPEMRDFGTRAWHGEDAMASLTGDHGHAYLGYVALAICWRC